MAKEAASQPTSQPKTSHTNREPTEIEKPHPASTDEVVDGDSFQIAVAILIALVTLISAFIGWQASTIKPESVERAGLLAVLNTESTRILNTAALYNNLRTHAVYALNMELLRQFAETPSLLEAKSSALVAREAAE